MSSAPPPARRDPQTGLHVAIAHDYVTQRGGAERVALALLRAFPQAALHTTLYNPSTTYPQYAEHEIHTSALNSVPAFRKDHRLALPFLAPAVSRMRIDADVVIASSSGWAHGIPTTGRRVVYCHAPARWLYQPTNYLGAPSWRSPQGLVLSALAPALRRWDRTAAQRADVYLANSRVVRDRIRDAYGLEATVVPAPHGVDPHGTSEPVAALQDWADGYHLIVSRLLPYKNVAVAIDAVRRTDDRLVIIGDGPLWDKLLADLPTNVRLVRGLSDGQMRWAYGHARTLVAPSLEDYGLTPLEAATFGTPTVALRGGGYLDTVDEGVTGVFFDEPTAPAIRAALRAREAQVWDTGTIREHATSFTEAAFAETLREVIMSAAGGGA